MKYRKVYFFFISVISTSAFSGTLSTLASDLSSPQPITLVAAADNATDVAKHAAEMHAAAICANVAEPQLTQLVAQRAQGGGRGVQLLAALPHGLADGGEIAHGDLHAASSENDR